MPDRNAVPDRTAEPVDVVVVSFNSSLDLDACLLSCRESVTADGTPNVGAIVVVDNGSADAAAAQTVAARHSARFVPTGANLGFARATNIGVSLTGSAYVLLLNPDATLEPDAVAVLDRALDADLAVGVAGPRVVAADGATYPSARSFPSIVDAAGHAFLGLVRPDNRYSRRYKHPESPDWVSGTAMLLRREAFEAIGGFDEDYFMYVEDVDFCWRLTRRGWNVAYVDGAVVRHLIGGSSEHHPYRMVVAHHRSLWRFAVRSERGWRRVLLPAVAIGLFARTGMAWIQRLVRGRPHAAM